MTSHRISVLFALLLPACAAHEGPTDPPTPAARVEIKVASVQLMQDCSDPPGDAAAEAAAAATASGPAVLAQARAEPTPVVGAVARQEISAAAAMQGDSLVGGWTPPCTQSTVQLSVANVGDRDGKLRIEAVRLLDAASKRALSKVQARKPSQWNPAGTYQPWNEAVPVGATLKVGYRLGEPDWSAVDAALGGAGEAHPYVLEIDVSVDGVSQTVRSPEFVREPVHVIVT